MKILEDFKEILYDILGFVLPGMFAMIIFIPMMIVDIKIGDSREITFNAEKLKSVITNVNGHIDDPLIKFFIEHKTMSVFLWIIIAYLIGCVVYFAAKTYYGLMVGVMKLCKQERESKYEKLMCNLLDNLKSTNRFLEISIRDDSSEKHNESVSRYALRRKDSHSLVAKYIGKYNFFMCCSFIFLIASSVVSQNIWGIPGLFIFILAHMIMKLAMGWMNDKVKKSDNEKIFNGIRMIIIFGFACAILILKNYYVITIPYVIHIALNDEYIRHYDLSKKEAFLGMADYLSK